MGKTNIYNWALQAIGVVCDDPEKQQLFTHIAYVAKEAVEARIQQTPTTTPPAAAATSTAPKIQALPQPKSAAPASATPNSQALQQTQNMGKGSLKQLVARRFPWLQK
jgi:hypothetical protein